MTQPDLPTSDHGPTVEADPTDELLLGAYDTHVHCSPDIVPRTADFFGVAQDAIRVGLAGLAFKDVGQPTVDRAYAVKRCFPELATAGGVVLDFPVGGLNPLAVDRCLRSGGTIVWMPVVHSRHMVTRCANGLVRTVIPQDLTPERAIAIQGEAGELVDVVREIVALVRDRQATLMTGHLAPEESLALARYARAEGVERVVVTHPCGDAIGASIEMQRALAQAGARLEHCYAQCTPGLDNLPIQRIAEAIRAVGAEHCILATDLGQTFNPSHVDGLRQFLRSLLAHGISERELRRMVQENPSTIFG